MGETMLGSLGGMTTAATALNNLGQVVGYGSTNPDETYAFLWDAEAGMRNLGSLEGTFSRALGVNEFGQVSGLAMDTNWIQFPVVWSPDSTVTILEAPSGWAEATDLNESGVVAGVTGSRPVRWAADGTSEDLGYVVESGWVGAVNSSGAICGASDLPGDRAYYEGVVWEPDGTFRPLGVWTNAGSAAQDINDLGEVVGYAGLIPYAPTRAVHWSPDGTMTDLNAFVPAGWELQEAVAINERGDITGVGIDATGVRQAVVLWKTDLPATVDGAAPPRRGTALGQGRNRR